MFLCCWCRRQGDIQYDKCRGTELCSDQSSPMFPYREGCHGTGLVADTVHILTLNQREVLVLTTSCRHVGM
jgi:hypothetical protein